MGGLRMGELLIILVVVLILFGAARLPQLGSSLGQAIRNFKRGFGGEDDGQNSKEAGVLTGGSSPTEADKAAKSPSKTA